MKFEQFKEKVSKLTSKQKDEIKDRVVDYIYEYELSGCGLSRSQLRNFVGEELLTTGFLELENTKGRSLRLRLDDFDSKTSHFNINVCDLKYHDTIDEKIRHEETKAITKYPELQEKEAEELFQIYIAGAREEVSDGNEEIRTYDAAYDMINLELEESSDKEVWARAMAELVDKSPEFCKVCIDNGSSDVIVECSKKDIIDAIVEYRENQSQTKKHKMGMR
ncbi:MAG: hypothetical protein LBT17_00850 [Mycoplasmataceae bacterium]|jgi:hypothetical protein|nr:hypothetical protein [Mycoplasmataceae bacterium]